MIRIDEGATKALGVIGTFPAPDHMLVKGPKPEDHLKQGYRQNEVNQRVDLPLGIYGKNEHKEKYYSRPLLLNFQEWWHRG